MFMNRYLNTIDDYIALLQDAKSNVGGNVKVRFVSQCYVNDTDEQFHPEDVILFGSKSLIKTNKNDDDSTRMLFVIP
jgi:hypothetical protein